MSSTATSSTDTATVEIDRVFDAAIDRIWQMFTDPEELVRWSGGDWYEQVAIDVDLRVGGVIHHRVTRRDNGDPWTFHGVYHEIVEGERLVYSFDWKADWREDPTPSMVAIDFSPTDDGKTAVHLEHSNVARPGVESTDEHWSHFLDRLAEVA